MMFLYPFRRSLDDTMSQQWASKIVIPPQPISKISTDLIARRAWMDQSER